MLYSFGLGPLAVDSPVRGIQTSVNINKALVQNSTTLTRKHVETAVVLKKSATTEQVAVNLPNFTRGVNVSSATIEKSNVSAIIKLIKKKV